MRAGNAVRSHSLTRKVLAEELGQPDVSRLRLTGTSGRIVDTHYVRAITLALGGTEIRVSLAFLDINDELVTACLDVAASEWSRIHERHGSPSAHPGRWIERAAGRPPPRQDTARQRSAYLNR